MSQQSDTAQPRPLPSQTPQGIGWLANFKPEDAPAAQLLIDSLHFVSSTTFRQSLANYLNTVLAEASPDQQPAALYSVFSCGAGTTMFTGGLQPLVPQEGGSELIVQNLVRATERAFQNSAVSNRTSSLELLKARRVRRLVFVSDYAGSGDEALAYARAWLRNPTIRSWRSLKLVQLHLVLFAASASAHSRLAASPWYDGVHVLHSGMDVSSAGWTASERDHIRSVCDTYARSATGGRGWGGSEGLVVFEHTISNNLPMILRQTKGQSAYGGKWVPFFQNRTTSTELMRMLEDYRPGADRQRRLLAVGQPRLADASQLQTMQRPELTRLIDVLAHIAGGRRHASQLSACLGISVPAAWMITRQACQLGLLGERLRLTDAGRQLLREERARPRRVTAGLQGSTDPYYPRRLKGSR